MAKRIIPKGEPPPTTGRNLCPDTSELSAKLGQLQAPGVRLTNDLYWYDEYRGTFEALIAAGLCRDDQLPGRPGMGAGRTTFYDGIRVRKGVSNIKRDNKYLTVGKTGRICWVRVGVPVHIQKARMAVRAQEWEAERNAAATSEIDAERQADFRRGYEAADATFRRHRVPEQKRTLPAGWRVIVNPNPRLDGPRV